MSTITEALAEIKTVQKRIATQQEFVNNYLFRTDNLKDPLEKDGGSPQAIAERLQSIGDLQNRVVELRTAIQKANDNTNITLEGETKTISDWLIWRREVAPHKERFLSRLASKLSDTRDLAKRTVYRGLDQQDKQVDIIVNVSEDWLAKEREKLNNILGQLDGQLSLKNATVLV